MRKTTLILQDISPDFRSSHNDVFFAGNRTARCKGCFGCWLKTPGECVMHDGSEFIGNTIANSHTVIIVSDMLYGGFSVPIKRVLDRSIPMVLPFFRKMHGRLHHVPRYQNKPIFKIFFYNSAYATQQEIALAERVAKAMAINFNCSECFVSFIENTPNLEELCQ